MYMHISMCNTYFSRCSKHMRSLATLSFLAIIFFRLSMLMYGSTLTPKLPPVVVLILRLIIILLGSVPVTIPNPVLLATVVELLSNALVVAIAAAMAAACENVCLTALLLLLSVLLLLSLLFLMLVLPMLLLLIVPLLPHPAPFVAAASLLALASVVAFAFAVFVVVDLSIIEQIYLFHATKTRKTTDSSNRENIEHKIKQIKNQQLKTLHTKICVKKRRLRRRCRRLWRWFNRYCIHTTTYVHVHIQLRIRTTTQMDKNELGAYTARRVRNVSADGGCAASIFVVYLLRATEKCFCYCCYQSMGDVCESYVYSGTSGTKRTIRGRFLFNVYFFSIDCETIYNLTCTAVTVPSSTISCWLSSNVRLILCNCVYWKSYFNIQVRRIWITCFGFSFKRERNYSEFDIVYNIVTASIASLLWAFISAVSPDTIYLYIF